MGETDRGGATVDGGQDAQILIRTVRELTEEQFDFWINCLNRAVVAIGGDEAEFTRDDRQKTVSYWYVLMFLLEIYAKEKNPFEVQPDETWLSDGIVSMRRLSRDLRDRYKEETVRRYVSDLKRCGLIAHDGRGPEAMVRLSAQVILALTDTMKQWVRAFRDLDQRFTKMGGW